VPAENASFGWKVFVNGKWQKVTMDAPHSPSIFFPTESTSLTASIGGDWYAPVMNGEKIVTFNVSVSYDGPSEHYDQCQAFQYAPKLNGAWSLGPCKPN
jgi:hypothetical protein